MTAEGTGMPAESGASGPGLREMLDALPVAVYMTDAEGKLTYFNAAAVKLAGRTPELGTDQWSLAWKILLPDGTAMSPDRSPMAAALRGGPAAAGAEYLAERPDGSRFRFAAYPAVLRDSAGGIAGGIILLVDTTAGRNALNDTEAQFRTMVETTFECIKLLKPDGTLLMMNPAGLALLEAPSGESVVGRSVYEFIAPEDRARFREFHEAASGGGRAVLEFDIVSLAGGRRHVESHATPLRLGDGSTVLLAVTRDVTGRRDAEHTARLLSAIVDASDDAIVSKDLNGIITSWNRSAERLFGYSADEAVGKPITIIIPPDRLDEEPKILATLRRGERVDHFETVRRRKDGTLVDISLTISPVRDAKGKIVGASKIARDITRLKREQEANMLLSAIVDSSDDAIISKDLNGIITSWNQSAERLFGYTAEEAVGQPITMLIPEDRLDEEPDILSRLRRGERVEHFETIRRRKDGMLLSISLTISPVRDASGRVIGASKIARDITERKRIESALVASEQRFRHLADSMPQIVWTARGDGFLDYYNERWYEFTGLARESFGDASWEPVLHPEDAQRCKEAWYASVHSGKPYQIEFRLWDRGERRWRWFMGRALPVRDASARIVRWFGTATDIDAQKHIEDELRRANQDLERFAFSASHDLQEPLRTVSIYSELLTERYAQKLDGEALEFLGYLNSAATRMQMLVRDLLAYTRVTKLEAPTELADANEALAMALANLAGAVGETGARITSGPLPRLRVHSAHLQQLFQNLIGNAIKYRSPDRPPEIRVSTVRANGSWSFAVADNGIGIEPEYREAIFGLFKRLHGGLENPGTGIGLAICQRIVERYQGRIWVESEPGQGSTFRFTLPLEGE
ncbi:MAG TPA: PAS domain S-box protein [Candidatus Acidoferrales bacterium]|nr:PAS domain S-box protein [Candidatus Acidoferrales bacterium]